MLMRTALQSFRTKFRGSMFQTLRRSCSSLSEKQLHEKFQVKAVADNESLSIQWKDKCSRFHHVWLRHHCPCRACFNPNTRQRLIDLAMIPSQIKPLEVQVQPKEVQVKWQDGHQSTFDSSWLRENAYDCLTKEKVKSGFGSIANESERMLWNKEIIVANPPPHYRFHELKNNASLYPSLLDNLFRYGFTFVDDTPLDTESLAQVCEFFGGHVQETLFGRVYVLENKDLAYSDVAYLHNALHGHTDHTYFEAPAGIQAMHCTYHDGAGGVTLLVDGFNAAKILYKDDPEAYKILTTTQVPFEYNSQDHIIRVHGPMLELNPFTHELVRVRHNNARIGPFINMNLTFEEMGKFYQAVQLFGSILRRPENELWFKLKPGRVLVMDNSRTLHGRSEVSGPRKLMGCYVAIDDFHGKWKAMKSVNQKEH